MTALFIAKSRQINYERRCWWQKNEMGFLESHAVFYNYSVHILLLTIQCCYWYWMYVHIIKFLMKNSKLLFTCVRYSSPHSTPCHPTHFTWVTFSFLTNFILLLCQNGFRQEKWMCDHLKGLREDYVYNFIKHKAMP